MAPQLTCLWDTVLGARFGTLFGILTIRTLLLPMLELPAR